VGRRRALPLLVLAATTLGLLGRAAASAALQVAAEPGPEDLVGVWTADWPDGDFAGQPAAGLEIVLTPAGPAIDIILYRYKAGANEPPHADRPRVVSHRVEKGVLYFRTRQEVPKRDGGPPEVLEADFTFSAAGKDAGQLRVMLPKRAGQADGEDAPPAPPPLAMKRVKR